MKHIKTATKTRRPDKAEIPVLDDVVCQLFPDKEKCDGAVA